MTATSVTAPDARLVRIAKALGDLDDVARLLKQGIPGTKPWQRRLSEHVTEVDRLLLVMRLAVAIERPDSEILEASVAVHSACRSMGAAITGSRADGVTRDSVRLAIALAAHLHSELQGKAVG